MRYVIVVAVGLVLAMPPQNAFALELCVAMDRDTGEPKENSSVKLRSECKKKRDGTPKEVSIGTTEELASVPLKADQVDLEAIWAQVCPSAFVGGACWFLAKQGEGCDDVCANEGLSYDDATRLLVGSSGTDENCGLVLDALGAGGSGNSSPDTCKAGYGCLVGVSGDRKRCTSPDTIAPPVRPHSQRACACGLS